MTTVKDEKSSAKSAVEIKTPKVDAFLKGAGYSDKDIGLLKYMIARLVGATPDAGLGLELWVRGPLARQIVLSALLFSDAIVGNIHQLLFTPILPSRFVYCATLADFESHELRPAVWLKIVCKEEAIVRKKLESTEEEEKEEKIKEEQDHVDEEWIACSSQHDCQGFFSLASDEKIPVDLTRRRIVLMDLGTRALTPEILFDIAKEITSVISQGVSFASQFNTGRYLLSRPDSA